MKWVGSSSASNILLKKVGSSSSCSSSSSSSLQQTPNIRSSDQELCNKRNQNKSSDLTMDIWIEIFLLLPLKAIFKNRCVSKVWFSILSSPSFIHKWMKINSLNISSPWTIIYSIDFLKANQSLEQFSLAYLHLHSQFIACHDGFSFEFLHSKQGSLYQNNTLEEKEGLYFLGSSNGLVLCSSTIENQIDYFVCNPLTKKWVSLPPPLNIHGDVSRQPWVVNGFFCELSSSSVPTTCSTSYKVVRIPEFINESALFDVEIFSSDSGEWKTYRVSCPDDEVAWQFPMFSNVVTHNGVLYWIEGRNRLVAYPLNDNYNDETGSHQCRLIELPDQEFVVKNSCRVRCDIRGGRCLGESEGFLCFANIDKELGTLSTWVLKDDDWLLVHQNIELDTIIAEFESRLTNLLLGGINIRIYIEAVAFNPGDQNVVIIGFRNYLVAFNIQTRGYEELFPPSFPAYLDPFRVDHKILPFVLTPRPTIIPPPSWVDIPKGLEF